MNLGALDLVLDYLLVVNTVSRVIWVWKPQGSSDWIASLTGLCCLPVWFSPMNAVRTGALPFWGGYADWGSDEDKELKTILHPSSSSDDRHDSESRTKARSFLALAFFGSSSLQRVTQVVFGFKISI